jgi:glycosyltransferase involved in cell wall biosynthesis
MASLIISMPVYNEAEGIFGFLSEIREAIKSIDFAFVIVDDHSTDASALQIANFKNDVNPYLDVYSLYNEENLGHGPSVLRGLQRATDSEARFVLSIDGDGQFLAEEIARAIVVFIEGNYDVLEAQRVERKEPIFRKLVTFATKIIVFLKTSRIPNDANTPFRIYRSEILKEVLRHLPEDSLVPNLRSSIICRRKGLRIQSIKVTCIPRRGSSKVGTMWKSTKTNIPSKQFISFCFRALREIIAA